MSERSNSANTPSIWNSAFPTGVLVSTPWRSRSGRPRRPPTRQGGRAVRCSGGPISAHSNPVWTVKPPLTQMAYSSGRTARCVPPDAVGSARLARHSRDPGPLPPMPPTSSTILLSAQEAREQLRGQDERGYRFGSPLPGGAGRQGSAEFTAWRLQRGRGHGANRHLCAAPSALWN
jgi:hypothetical protein